MTSRKLAIRDEPNIRLTCSRHVKHSLVLPMKNTRLMTILLLPTLIPSPPLPPVCPFDTSPCVPAPRAHVFQHVRVVPVHTETFWTDTYHTPHTTPHPKTQHNTTQHDTPHHTTTTRPQHHTETEKEDRERLRRREKRKKTEREERTKEKERERQEKTKWKMKEKMKEEMRHGKD